MVTYPVKVAPDKAALLAILFVIVVAKLGSLPKAIANSLSVSNVDGAEATKLLISVRTNEVEAI